MRSLPQHPIAPASYLNRQPERMVLEGYRNWIRGTVLRYTVPWTDAQLLDRDLLGDEDGAEAIIALAGFTKTLGQCAICPLSVLRSGCQHVCRDETLVMGLIAGMQNGDEDAIHLCMEALCCLSQFGPVAAVAGNYALTLKRVDQAMLRIPADFVRRVALRTTGWPRAVPTLMTIH